MRATLDPVKRDPGVGERCAGPQKYSPGNRDRNLSVSRPISMSSTEYLVALLSSAAVSACLTAALFWLLQNWISERLRNAIKHEYDVKLESHRAQLVASFGAANETHKAKLHADNAQAVERLKADLQVAAAERQVRFARLYEKVAECVAEMYLRLSSLTIAVSRYTSVVETSAMGSKEEASHPPRANRVRATSCSCDRRSGNLT